MNLDNSIIYDIETFPNVFSFAMEKMFDDTSSVWEISEYRDDRVYLFQFFEHLRQTQTPMIGFNSLFFDYPVIHWMMTNQNVSVKEIYDFAMTRINSQDRFGGQIWADNRFAPQIDLFKLHHFDNKAKTTSLKALQINMRSENVIESAAPFGTNLTSQQIDRDLIPYNKHDVSETKKFAHHSLGAIKFRTGFIDQFGLDVLNYNDTKLGEKILEQKIGNEICYDYSSGRKKPRQTVRDKIPLNDIIFPYITFQHPEFIRVLDYMKSQTLKPEDIDTEAVATLGDDRQTVQVIKTKGVFTGLHAEVGGLTFHFGTGGVHASVPPQRIVATDEWLIRDIDVAALYPSIAIVNRLAPEHLGEAFIIPYSEIPKERKKYAKGTYENAGLKLAANGAWGKSNSIFSVFYDPKYAMTVPINGQLMVSMLAEWLLAVPTIRLIQVNTDGITYYIHRDYLDQAKAIEKRWQEYTCLELEDVFYSHMFIRDVNNYIAVKPSKPGSNQPPEMKCKGAYWTPDPLNYAKSLSNASPPAWYKDLSNLVSIRAAVAAMVHGIEPEWFIRAHTDKFDFMCRARANRGASLEFNGAKVQSTCRYYVANDGGSLTKKQPALGPIGAYKRKREVSEGQWLAVMQANGWQWDASVCTGNKSRYEERVNAIEAGYKVALCNTASHFRFDNVNYDYYVAEARKLIIN